MKKVLTANERESRIPLLGRGARRAGWVLSVLLLTGCTSIRPPRGVPPRTVMMETTGYCACRKCCGWKRVWRAPWRTVYAYGPNKGKPKKVGITASGVKAHKGTIAADPRYYPFGTVMVVPGYGYGRVEDIGRAIQGPAHIDLFFSSHRQAIIWGRRRIPVKVWRQAKSADHPGLFRAAQCLAVSPESRSFRCR